MSNELASTIVSDVLVYGIYGTCILLVLMMTRFTVMLARNDRQAREDAAARRAWEQMPEGEAAVRAEALAMEQEVRDKKLAEHRAKLEADWPQTVVQELP